ncbi:MAG TPA: hypothetical protein VLH38_05490 [Patescibacteria group bacterium]|nr:hypothetical protein [Patescibacteria group bacterium]
MQPQTIQKPVMDVAAPHKPAVPAVPQSVQPTPLPVIRSTSPLAVQAAPAKPETPAEAAAAMPVPAVDLPAEKTPQRHPAGTSRTPAGLITLTICAMLILAGLAVAIYVTSAK